VFLSNPAPAPTETGSKRATLLQSVSGIAIGVGTCTVAIALSLSIRTLQRQNEEVLDELNQIRQLVENGVGAAQVSLTDLSGEFLGSADAPLTIVEFSDLQCPFCRQFHTAVFEQIRREYIDTGKLRYFARDFPLDTIHSLAIPASRAVHCAGEQSRFWEMRHLILANNRSLRSDRFLEFARDLGLNHVAFENCTADTERIDARWQGDKAEAISAGVSGTPTFIIGRSTSTHFKGIRLSGAKNYASFDARFRELLPPDAATH
jgi:protein-disulfide isomerase